MSEITRRGFMAGVAASTAVSMGARAQDTRPNILLFMTDNQSWLHTAVTGTPHLNTPAFNRVAREGVLFGNAFTPCPSCSPARTATLTGQDIWRCGEGGVLWGTIPAELPTYADLLADAGYETAWCGKSWGPGYWDAGGRTTHPAGTEYNETKYEDIPDGYSDKNYAADFEQFISARNKSKPFCFWLGTHEPHRDFPEVVANDAAREQVELPEFLPDVPEIRDDFLGYYKEIEHADTHLARAIDLLEDQGILDNTIIVVTSDNGMQIPRGITCLYDYGVRLPFAVRWGSKCPPGRVVDDFASLTDLAPTFLEAAGITPPDEMTGRSLIPVLVSTESGRVDPKRDHVITAMERHTLCREGELPYPSRAIRTKDYLYIVNFEADRWPAGGPDHDWTEQGIYGDVDAGATKTWMIDHKDDPDVKPMFERGFGKRPAEELYSVTNDPDHMRNLANDADHADAKNALRTQLMDYLKATGDPRTRGESPWDTYPYRYPRLRRWRKRITNKAVFP